ncbi:MAG TPA: DUF5666 domain-containing protein [Anaerolineales bacterium]|nr:DUF5666 domain-containing protein [Anaerolineales bacterium]
MKKVQFSLLVFVVASIILSACGAPVPATAIATVGGGKVEPIPVAFLGTVESMAGDQWVINGQTVTVDDAVVRDGPFSAGDQVKVEGVVNPDGSFRVSRVEAPAASDISTLPRFGDENSNESDASDANTNDANVNDSNVNDDSGTSVNANDDNSNAVNLNDDNSNSANTNDDNSNDSNSNDDGSNDSNTNDDDGNDDNSGRGGDDNGDDDDDGNSNDD